MAIKSLSQYVVQPEDPALVKTSKTLVPSQPLKSSTVSFGTTLKCTNLTPTEVTATTSFNTDGTLYVTNVTQNTNNQFIDVTCGPTNLNVGTVDSLNNYTNVLSGVSKLGFDTDSGFDVTDLGSGLAKIGMNSTFKCWNVNGSPGLIACGLDTVNFIAGSGINITSDNTLVPKTFTISSSGGGGTPGGCNTQIQFNNSGAFGGSCNFTYCNCTSTLKVSNIEIPETPTMLLDESGPLKSGHTVTPKISNVGGTKLQILLQEEETGLFYLTYYDAENSQNASEFFQSAIDSDGNIISIGTQYGEFPNFSRVIITKHNSGGQPGSGYGNIIWQKTLTNANNYETYGSAVGINVEAVDNSIYFTFAEQDREDPTIYAAAYIVKIDQEAANIIWQKKFTINTTSVGPGGMYLTMPHILISSLGFLYVSFDYKSTQSGGSPRSKLGILKLDSGNGDLMWQRMIEDPGITYPFNYVWHMGMGPDNLPVLAYTYDEVSYTSNIIVKFDLLGNTLWQKEITNYVLIDGSYLLIDSTNNIYVTGYNSPILKISPMGNIIWEKTLGSIDPGDYGEFRSLKQDTQGNFYLVFDLQYGYQDGENPFVIKFDSNWNIVWQKKFNYSNTNYRWVPGLWNGNETDYLKIDALTNNLFITGLLRVNDLNPNGITDVASIIKISPDGEIGTGTWSWKNLTGTLTFDEITDFSITNTNTVDLIPSALLFDSTGGTYVAGDYALATLSLDNIVTNIGRTSNVMQIDSTTNSLSLTTFSLPFSLGSLGQTMLSDGKGGTYWDYSGFRASAGGSIYVGSYGSWNYGTSCSAENTALGIEALKSITCGINNVAVGYYALQCNVNGSCNTAVGYRAMASSQDSVNNIAIGAFSLSTPNCVNNNIAIGINTMPYVSANENIAIGTGSLLNTTLGTKNVALGHLSGINNTTGCSIINLGHRAGYCNTTGNNNIYLGECAGYCIRTGSNNTVIGSLQGSVGLSCTVLIGAGTCERIKVDNTGLYVNGFPLGGSGTYEVITSLTGATGTVVHNFSLGPLFNHTNIVSNFIANITNLGLSPGYSTNVVLILNQGAIPYIPNAVLLGAVIPTINWQGGSPPSGNANAKDIVSFSITNISGTYTVFGQLVSFA